MHYSLSPDAAAAKATPYRVAGITIRDRAFETLGQAEHGAVLFRVFELCVGPAYQRALAHVGGSDIDDIPAALVRIEVTFPDQQPTNASILGPLATDFPALVRSLLELEIVHNDYDESAALGAFAALAMHLQKLAFVDCGLTSLQGLDGHCEYLRKMKLNWCKLLSSIDALSNRVCLEEVDLSFTGISSVEPLRSCPRLTKVFLNDCEQLSSIEGMEGHQWLREFNASGTAITSIEPLRTSPALTQVYLLRCRQLSSIAALEGHLWLREVYASATGITSIEPLRSCPRLTKVYLNGCEQLSSIEGIEGHQWLNEVQVQHTGITSIDPLRSCPALKTARLCACHQLPADATLPASVTVYRRYR